MAVDRDGSLADTDRPAADSMDGTNYGTPEQANAAVMTDPDGHTAAEYIRDYNKRVKESLQSESRAGDQSRDHSVSLSGEHDGGRSPHVDGSDLDPAEEPGPQSIDRAASEPTDGALPESAVWSSLPGATDHNGLTSAQYIRQHNHSIRAADSATSEPDSGVHEVRTNSSESETDPGQADLAPAALAPNPTDGAETDLRPLDHTRRYTTLRETLDENAPVAPRHQSAGFDHGDQQVPEHATER